MTLREKVARKLAARHYAHRFGKPEDDPHVLLSVDMNWPDFEGDAWAVPEIILGEATATCRQQFTKKGSSTFYRHAAEQCACAIERLEERR